MKPTCWGREARVVRIVLAVLLLAWLTPSCRRSAMRQTSPTGIVAVECSYAPHPPAVRIDSLSISRAEHEPQWESATCTNRTIHLDGERVFQIDGRLNSSEADRVVIDMQVEAALPFSFRFQPATVGQWDTYVLLRDELYDLPAKLPAGTYTFQVICTETSPVARFEYQHREDEDDAKAWLSYETTSIQGKALAREWIESHWEAIERQNKLGDLDWIPSHVLVQVYENGLEQRHLLMQSYPVNPAIPKVDRTYVENIPEADLAQLGEIFMEHGTQLSATADPVTENGSPVP